MPIIIHHRLRQVSFRLPVFRRLAQRLLDTIGEKSSELSIELVGDRRMRRLNSRFRDMDRTTDVLAFALRDAKGPLSVLLGDVVISVPTAIRQARRFGHTVEEELVRLLIHGLLHLVGYDHERGEREANRMRRKEQELWRSVQPLPRIVMSKE